MTDPKVAKCLHDPKWRYVREDDSDIRKTFARIRKQQKQAEAKQADTHVVPMKKKVA